MSAPYDTPATHDAAAIAEYTAGVLYAREDYYARTQAKGTDYAKRTAASEKQGRYRARKKEQSK